MKVGRNDKCPCGSGKKHKKCCGDRSGQGVLEVAEAAALDGLEYGTERKQKSIRQLQEILQRPDLTSLERFNTTIWLAQTQQHLGEHRTALQTLSSLHPDDRLDHSEETILYLKAISLCALGQLDEGCAAFDALREQWQQAPNPQGEKRKIRGLQLIEAGKAYKKSNRIPLARECWETAVRYLQSFGEVEHLLRAESNVACLDLEDEDPAIQTRGVEALERLIMSKLKIGDIQGAATNYCNLGTYYREGGRYERAIAYYRQDLYLSNMVGDQRELATTHGNLGTLYAELKQFKSARTHLREAQEIGKALGDAHLLAITEHQLSFVEAQGREAGLSGATIGPQAPCACESGKAYVDCCGRADFEPINLPMTFGGISEDVGMLHKGASKDGPSPASRLDFLLRSTPEAQQRRAWCEIGVHDGWMSMRELPDMANIHWLSAKTLANRAQSSDEMSDALAAIVLSVCQLEAFANQLSYFLYEHRSDTHAVPFSLPPALITDGPIAYQRTTSLENKWSALTASLLGSDWLVQQPVWKDVRDLIYIRNELIHFKTAGYEQVVPPPSTLDPIYGKIPASAKVRDVPHSWPMRVVTPGLAQWAVEIAERLVEEVKTAYRASRAGKTHTGAEGGVRNDSPAMP